MTTNPDAGAGLVNGRGGDGCGGEGVGQGGGREGNLKCGAGGDRDNTLHAIANLHIQMFAASMPSSDCDGEEEKVTLR